MPYDWTEFENFVKNHPTYNLFKEKFTQQNSNPDRNYINFTFSQGSIYSGDYRLRVIQDKKRIHWLDIYFEKTGQEKDLPNVICPQLEDSRIHNWDFSLGKWNTGNRISRKFIPLNPQKIGDKQWIFNTMILIADNLPVIENNASALLDNKQNKADKTENKKKKEITKPQQKKEIQMPAIYQQMDTTLFPAGVNETAFNNFCNTEIQVPEYKNGKKTDNKRSMKIPEFASWAIWEKWDDSQNTRNTNLRIDESFLKGNIGNLQPNIVFVGLNISRILEKQKWENFHADQDQGNAFLRYALIDSIFWGAYLTDFIKGYPEPSGRITKNHFMQNNESIKGELNRHANNFVMEMQKLSELTEANSPLIIVLLGGDLQKLFPKAYENKPLKECADQLAKKIKKNIFIYERGHYTCHGGKTYDEYREHILTLQDEITSSGIRLDSSFTKHK